jgi:excisionase family DNA binding protein
METKAEKITFDNLPFVVSELSKKIDNLVRLTIEKVNNPQPEKKKKYYTRKETADLLHISLVTLNDYTNKGKLTSYKFGGRRVLYSCDEVEATLKQVEPIKYRRG